MFNEALAQVASPSVLEPLKTASLAILSAAALGASTPAVAAPANCGPRPELLKQLAKQYREAPVAVGLTENGALVEVLTSESGATWTIIVSAPNGTSCLVAAGEEWQPLKGVATDGHDV